MKIGKLPAGPSFCKKRPTGEVPKLSSQVRWGDDASN